MITEAAGRRSVQERAKGIRMNFWTLGIAFLSAAMVTACGGGGGESGPPAANGGGIPTSNGTIGSTPDYGGVQVKTVITVIPVTP